METSNETGTKPRGRVLVVDDDENVLLMVRRILSGAGFEVTTAAVSTEVIELLSKSTFDAVVSDIHMPKLDGIQLLRLIRLRNLELPVLLMTGEPDLSTARQAIALGALQYLVKPVDAKQLKTDVMRAVRLNYIARLKREAFRIVHEGELPAAPEQALGAQLDRALATMWMAYQPIVVAETQRIFAYEALLRAREPSLPHPGAVLDAAARLGRLSDVGRKVRMLVASRIPTAASDVSFFVNLHPSDLLDEDLYSTDAPLTAFASRIVLELTERDALHDINDVRDRVATLRGLGYRLAVDDLGAGYSGLSVFAALEPEIVKIDMSLVRGVDTSVVKQRLMNALASVSRELEILVVAEGVETTAERDTVVRLGCSLLQGYLLGKPAAELATVVAGG